MAIKLKNNKEHINNSEEKKDKKDKISKKGGKRSVAFSFLVFFLIGIVSVASLLAYPIIDKNASEYVKNYDLLDDYNLDREIVKTNYGIYYDYLENKSRENNKSLNPSQDFVIENRKDNYNRDSFSKNKIDDENRDINSRVNSLIRNLNNLGNLNVYAMDGEGNTVYKTNGEQAWLLEALAKGNKIDKNDLQDYFRFYIRINFDSKGNVSLKDVYGDNNNEVNKLLADMKSPYYLYKDEYISKPIENMTYVYAVPKTLQYKDSLYYKEMNYKVRSIFLAAIPFFTVGIVVIILLASLIPFKYTRGVLGFGKFSKIPLEVNLLLILIMIVLSITGGTLGLGALMEEGLGNGIRMSIFPYVNILTNILSWIYFMVIYTFVFFEILYIKSIFNMGFKNYIKKHSLIYRLKDFVIYFGRRFVNYIKGIDLNKNSDKMLVILVLSNFLVVSALCIFWFFGIFIALFYSIALFYFGRKYINKWKSDYNKILERTEEISKGNLDEKENFDCGFFNPMKEELNNIQRGFKTAVDEEVKSQRMKTELISNISHDLKTPLTSIIAYVDLLKGEEDEKKREAYLETLERKSQRLKELIEDLFEVTKATTGNVTLNIMDVDVSYLMKEVVLELEDKIKESSLDFRLSFPEEKVILKLDGQRTYRVFENLIINAIKYALPNSRVYIDIKNEEEEVYIIIKNISAEEINFDINEISDRFVRGDKSRNTEGAGLGLAIVKSFVELQGGKFNIVVDGDLFKAIIIFRKNSENI